jgi:hypothetical protein
LRDAIIVMPGLVPGIYSSWHKKRPDVDGGTSLAITNIG